ncbi:MAG TPA: N-acetylmuramic acid 6-phosphate etherase [Agriterribacter sp.]|nr:N-acetylmuramic acid 6-phosphate etherase [Agriterribacter sp.]HRQ49688.1 N-acetylmuramic acid 6-phosphate etherase [Agriterribacter sp.]
MMDKITEQPSLYRHLEKKTIDELTFHINKEDQKVAAAIQKALPQVNALISVIVNKLRNGGRMFYVGAGAGGRLAVLDTLELPTTYGIEKGIVNVVLAGGTENLVHAPEDQEDDVAAGWNALQELNISASDIVVGISASGSTPFVLASLSKCRQAGITIGCIVSNPSSDIAELADFPVEILTGPEFVTGSTRMKCGTAQKMIFDMISTTAMIQLGKVADNSMVNVQLVNNKIINRSAKMLMNKGGIEDYDQAKKIVIAYGSVQLALDALDPKRFGC